MFLFLSSFSVVGQIPSSRGRSFSYSKARKYAGGIPRRVRARARERRDNGKPPLRHGHAHNFLRPAHIPTRQVVRSVPCTFLTGFALPRLSEGSAGMQARGTDARRSAASRASRKAGILFFFFFLNSPHVHTIVGWRSWRGGLYPRLRVSPARKVHAWMKAITVTQASKLGFVSDTPILGFALIRRKPNTVRFKFPDRLIIIITNANDRNELCKGQPESYWL